MQSHIAQSLRLKHHPVAILWADSRPEGALQFEPGRWGCVMGAFGAVAERGKSAVFDRQTYGCWGGGVGLGFGNVYNQFIGGFDCFCRFLSDGNAQDPQGSAVAERSAQFMRGELRDHFLHGEGYRKSPELVKQFVDNMPLMEVPARYVVLKALDQVDDTETPQVVVFLGNPDQISALIVLANYGRGDNENVIVPFCAGCQSIGIFPYREARSARPRAVLGLNDLSARKMLRRLGRDLMTFAVPMALYREMEVNIAGSFLEKDTWKFLSEQ